MARMIEFIRSRLRPTAVVLNSEPRTVAVVVAATHHYVRFFPDFYESASRFLLPRTDKTFFIMTDAPEEDCLRDKPDVIRVRVEHHQWPFSTMLRFRFLAGIAEDLAGC